MKETDAWYKIWDIFFPEKKELTDGYVADKEEDMLSNYMELDALMQVIFPLKEGEADN